MLTTPAGEPNTSMGISGQVYSDMEGRIENKSLLYSRGEAFLKQQIGTP